MADQFSELEFQTFKHCFKDTLNQTVLEEVTGSTHHHLRGSSMSFSHSTFLHSQLAQPTMTFTGTYPVNSSFSYFSLLFLMIPQLPRSHGSYNNYKLACLCKFFSGGFGEERKNGKEAMGGVGQNLLLVNLCPPPGSATGLFTGNDSKVCFGGCMKHGLIIYIVILFFFLCFDAGIW